MDTKQLRNKPVKMGQITAPISFQKKSGAHKIKSQTPVRQRASPGPRYGRCPSPL
jgi:hypothetical protein